MKPNAFFTVLFRFMKAGPLKKKPISESDGSNEDDGDKEDVGMAGVTPAAPSAEAVNATQTSELSSLKGVKVIKLFCFVKKLNRIFNIIGGSSS